MQETEVEKGRRVRCRSWEDDEDDDEEEKEEKERVDEGGYSDKRVRLRF